MPDDRRSHLTTSNHGGDRDNDDNQTFQSILDILPRGDDGGVQAAPKTASGAGRRRSTKARNKRLSALAPLIFVVLVALLLIIFIILG